MLIILLYKDIYKQCSICFNTYSKHPYLLFTLVYQVKTSGSKSRSMLVNVWRIFDPDLKRSLLGQGQNPSWQNKSQINYWLQMSKVWVKYILRWKRTTGLYFSYFWHYTDRVNCVDNSKDDDKSNEDNNTENDENSGGEENDEDVGETMSLTTNFNVYMVK